MLSSHFHSFLFRASGLPPYNCVLFFCCKACIKRRHTMPSRERRSEFLPLLLCKIQINSDGNRGFPAPADHNAPAINTRRNWPSQVNSALCAPAGHWSPGGATALVVPEMTMRNKIAGGKRRVAYYSFRVPFCHPCTACLTSTIRVILFSIVFLAMPMPGVVYVSRRPDANT